MIRKPCRMPKRTAIKLYILFNKPRRRHTDIKNGDRSIKDLPPNNNI